MRNSAAVYDTHLQRGLVLALPQRANVLAWPNRNQLRTRRRLRAIPPISSKMLCNARSIGRWGWTRAPGRRVEWRANSVGVGAAAGGVAAVENGRLMSRPAAARGNVNIKAYTASDTLSHTPSEFPSRPTPSIRLRSSLTAPSSAARSSRSRVAAAVAQAAAATASSARGVVRRPLA
jgi:hypothetical protein